MGKISPVNGRRVLSKSASKSGERQTWVQCDSCRECELLGNDGVDTERDEKKVQESKFVCRLCRMEARLAVCELLEFRLKGVEDAMEVLTAKIEKVESVVADQLVTGKDLEVDLEGKLKVASQEVDSKVAVSGFSFEGRVNELQKTVDELRDRIKAYETLVIEWPKIGEGTQKADKARKAKGVSFAEKFKNKGDDTIVVMGDSLVRGVGLKLQTQSQMCSTVCKGGARIEDIEEEIGKLQDNEDRHLVVMVGTNNVKVDGSEVVYKKYERLVESLKKIKNRAVTLIGIPRRYDVGGLVNSRRWNINARLKELCSTSDIKYLEYECGESRLGQDRLHLNGFGQDELARMIFCHCKSFLV